MGQSQCVGKSKTLCSNILRNLKNMPIYRYRCINCETEFETFYLTQSAVEREESEEACPHCASKEKEKLVNTGTSFQLKGGGWAKDRYGGSRGK